MEERLVQIALDDGNGNFTVPSGRPAKYIPGTIVNLYPIDFEYLLNFGDKDKYLMIKGRGNLFDEVFQNDQSNWKKSIDVLKFLSGPSLDKYQANVTAHYNFILTQDAEGGHHKAAEKRKKEFDANGHKPDFTRVVFLDAPGFVIDTPTWQHAKED